VVHLYTDMIKELRRKAHGRGLAGAFHCVIVENHATKPP
jgi:hypothetical protein